MGKPTNEKNDSEDKESPWARLERELERYHEPRLSQEPGQSKDSQLAPGWGTVRKGASLTSPPKTSPR